jgi:hypothetical protein
MDQLARSGALIAADGLRRLEVAHPAEAELAENSTDGGGREAQLRGDPLAGPALAAQRGDPVRHRLRGRAAQTVRARGPVAQPGRALRCETGDPLAHRLRRDAEIGRDPRHRLALNQDPPHHLPSTVRRQAGILMSVHPGLPQGLKHRNSSLYGRTRMDNLMKAHT